MSSLSSKPHTLLVSFVQSMEDIGAATWNALAGTDNPFMRYEFLAALENNNCTTEATGWHPDHALISAVNESRDIEEFIGVVPLYFKNNSWGEYVFDWSWAHAYEQHGLSYYPKLVTSAPFTPSVGKRFFIKEGFDERVAMALVKKEIESRAAILGISSWHILFPEPEQHELLTSLDLLPRSACQFHWYNQDYKNFDDFLATMNSRKRKNIRKERKAVAEAGITFRTVPGSEIHETLWREFYVFYNSTYLVRGMHPHLTQEFFMEVGRTMPEQLFMVCAELDGKLIAAALFFQDSETIYGRYWGSSADYQFLHFETCYYQGQDYAIKHGFKHFDSGAQGEHKIQRGFEPITTYSNHWIANPAFRQAIAEFLEKEQRQIERYGRAAAELLPFKANKD